jgi:hypothetical protein
MDMQPSDACRDVDEDVADYRGAIARFMIADAGKP